MNDRPPAANAADTLVEYIETACRKRCEGLRQDAESAVRRLLRDTRRRANRGVREAIRLERSRVSARRREAAARDALARRTRYQAGLEQAVDAALPHVVEALEAHWHHPEGRRQWLAHTVSLAERRLAGRQWTVSGPPGLDLSGLAWPDSVTVTLRSDPRLSAGLVIEADSARLDSTITGLMAREAWIRGRLLGFMAAEGAGR